MQSSTIAAGALRAARRTHLVFAVKTLIAALLAWAAAGLCAPADPPYLAVATALLMVNASTVYQSVTRSAQSVLARLAGLMLALVAVRLLGPTAAAVAVIVVVPTLAGPRRTADDRMQVASIAVVGLAAAATEPVGGLLSSVLQTLVGAVVGVTVHALVLPPLYVEESDSAVRSLARTMGTLLRDMGTGLRHRRLATESHVWLHRARKLDECLSRAEEQVRQAEESLRWNTRCAAHAHRGGSADSVAFKALRGVSLQVRGIARTLVDDVFDGRVGSRLGRQFLDRYAEILQWAGAAVLEFVEPAPQHGPAGVTPRERLRGAIEGALAWHESMTGLVRGGGLAEPGAWHVYGSLMTDVERILADLDHAHWRSERLARRAGR